MDDKLAAPLRTPRPTHTCPNTQTVSHTLLERTANVRLSANHIHACLFGLLGNGRLKWIRCVPVGAVSFSYVPGLQMQEVMVIFVQFIIVRPLIFEMSLSDGVVSELWHTTLFMPCLIMPSLACACVRVGSTGSDGQCSTASPAVGQWLHRSHHHHYASGILLWVSIHTHTLKYHNPQASRPLSKSKVGV